MDYMIEDRYKIKTNHGSKGCQIKYFKDNYWYKLDTSCNEGRNEYFASLILKCSTMQNFVDYEACTVNNKLACKSSNFLGENEILITLSEIICRHFGVEKAEDYVWSNEDVLTRFNIIVDTVKEFTGGELDISEYLITIFYLDMFILNRDRHFENLGVIIDTNTERYRVAPIFDNGLSFLGGYSPAMDEIEFENAIEEQSARTISGSFIKQVSVENNKILSSPFKIDFDKLNSLIDNDPNITKLQRQVLEYQYKNIGKLYK